MENKLFITSIVVLILGCAIYGYYLILDRLRAGDPVKIEIADSDFGRRYGWYIEREGVTIGELEYVRWDSHMQFWHDYQLRWYHPSNAVSGPNEWSQSKLSLRNRRYADVVIDQFLTAEVRKNGEIPIRFAYVTEEQIRQGLKAFLQEKSRVETNKQLP